MHRAECLAVKGLSCACLLFSISWREHCCQHQTPVLIRCVHKTRLSLSSLVNLVLSAAWWASWDWATHSREQPECGGVWERVEKNKVVCRLERLQVWFCDSCDGGGNVVSFFPFSATEFDINAGQFPGLKLCQCVWIWSGALLLLLPRLRERRQERKGGKSKRGETGRREERGAVMYASL